MKRQLPRNRVLAALSPGDLDLLRPEDVDFSRGEILFDSNGRVDQIYFPHTALVSLLTHLKPARSVMKGLLALSPFMATTLR